MNIRTYKPDEINIPELAAFMFRVRRAELKMLKMSLRDLEAKLRVWQFIGYVLARSDDDLTGYVLRFQIGDSDLVKINPGTLLGHYPIVAPRFDERQVGAKMIETAKKSVVEQMLQMNKSLPAEVFEVELPLDIQLAQIQSADAEALYQCHHQAYLQGDAWYYFQMGETERRDDFEPIYAPHIREHPAALALTQNGVILGDCLLFGQADFSELMSLAVHPDHRRKGYGRLLMNECIERAGEEGHKRIHLIVDVNNEGAAAPYRQHGFTETGGNMTLKCKI